MNRKTPPKWRPCLGPRCGKPYFSADPGRRLCKSCRRKWERASYPRLEESTLRTPVWWDPGRGRRE